MGDNAMDSAVSAVLSSKEGLSLSEQDLMKGDAAYIIEDYDTALLHFESALQTLKQWRASQSENDAAVTQELLFRILLHRSSCFIHLQQYETALSSAQEALSAAVAIGSSDVQQKELEFAHRQCAIAAFALQDFGLSHDSFQKALHLSCHHSQDKYNESYYQDWTKKCQDQMSSSTAISPSVASPSASASDVSSSRPSPSKRDIAAMTPKYQYYQNGTTMTIVILEPNVQAADLKVNYGSSDTHHSIHVQLTKRGCELPIIQGELYDGIVPDKCKVSIRADKVLIKLHKEHVNYEWHNLLSDVKQNKSANKNTTEHPSTASPGSAATAKTPSEDLDASVPSMKPSAIPKAYATHRDWDQIEKDLDAEMQKEAPVGDEAMNRLFQQIYANANEDTRRAMIKSFQTSGGTVLSTNWEEVAAKDYEKERVAPEGQEWKTWEGRKL